MSAMTNTWIFQGKPEIWDGAAGVQLPGDIHWVVRQHQHDVRAGDTVYIWQSGANAGIIAVAVVTSPPALSEDTEAEIELYPEGPPPDFQGKQIRVTLRVNRRLATPLTKIQMRDHPVLRDLSIIRNPRGTNFAVSDQQAAELTDLAMAHQ
jgi:predicted RNA-binding protein with PUA-like domain